mgnify:CR=1 FL=1
MKPMERKLMATIPATTPGPMIETSKSDQIRELIEREETIINRARGRMNLVLGEVFRAAKKAIGTAITIAIIVPMVAMFSVSQSGPHNSLM